MWGMSPSVTFLRMRRWFTGCFFRCWYAVRTLRRPSSLRRKAAPGSSSKSLSC